MYGCSAVLDQLDTWYLTKIELSLSACERFYNREIKFEFQDEYLYQYQSVISIQIDKANLSTVGCFEIFLK